MSKALHVEEVVKASFTCFVMSKLNQSVQFIDIN